MSSPMSSRPSKSSRTGVPPVGMTKPLFWPVPMLEYTGIALSSPFSALPPLFTSTVMRRPRMLRTSPRP